MTISIIMPELRVRESMETYAAAVRDAAARIEARVGWRPFGPMPTLQPGKQPAAREVAPDQSAFARYEVMA
jgi:hypothetical protein